MLDTAEDIHDPEVHEELGEFLKSLDLPFKFELTPIRVEASHRRYFRLIFPPGEDPESLILCCTGPLPAPDDDDFIFLARHLEKAGLPVPRIYGVEPKRGWLIQTDGGEQDLNAALSIPLDEGDLEGSADLLRKTLDILIQLHRVEVPKVVHDRAFDFDKLIWEMRFLEDKVETLCAERDLKSPYTYEFRMFVEDICTKLGKQGGQVFTHRDFHSRNLLCRQMDGDLEFLMVDFQDARMGLPWYDLSSFLFDPYLPLPLSLIQQGLEYYMQGSDVGKGGAQWFFFASAFQRIMKALGSYLFLSFEKKQWAYFDSIKPALDQLELIIQLGRLPDTAYLFLTDLRTNLYPRLSRG